MVTEGHPEEERQPRRQVERVLDYVDEPALWPVVVVAIAQVSTVLALAMLRLVRDGNLLAGAALFALVFPSVAVCRWERGLRGRLGGLTVTVVLMWLVGALFAWLANRYGLA